MYIILRIHICARIIYDLNLMAQMGMHNIIILRETVCILTVDDHHTVQTENRFGFSLAGYFQLTDVRFGRGINGLKWRLIFPGERENIR